MSNGSSLTLSRPTGVVADDVLLAVIDVRGLPSITAPPGWSLVRTDSNGTALRQALYVRTAQAGEPTSYTWGFGNKYSVSGAVLAYTGVSTSQPIDGATGLANASSNSISSTALTTTVSDTAVIGFFGTAINTTVSPPSGMREQAEIAAGRDKVTSEAADLLQSGAGSTGVRIAISAAAAVNIGQLVVLRPADAPSDDELPTAPTSLAATAVSASQINLDWTASTDNIGVVHYEISRGTTIVGTSTGTEFSDTGLAPETEYTYTVRAFDAAGNASAASEPASTTTLAGSGGSAITFRAASSAGERSTASLSLAQPSGAQPGDMLIASLDVRGTPTITAPAGWALVRSDPSGGTMTKATYWHLVGPSDSGPYVWGFSSADAATGIVLAYSGVDPTSPIDAHSGATSSATAMVAPTVTCSAGAMIVALFGLATNGSITQPTGMTERSELTAGVGQARVASEVSDQIHGAGGSTGDRTATTTRAAPSVGQLIALRPAP